MENEKNFTSTFIFFSKYKRKIQSFIGAKKNHKNLMENVLNNKREIGLHGSSNAALSKYTMEKEKMELENIINLKINGYRQHLLNYVFKIPDTINYLSQLNLLYDISINDNDIFGFMKGICFPYHPIIYEKKINLVEISVPYEDWISLSRKFTYNNQIDIINELFETTKKYNGCLTLCIHNNYININKYKDFYNLYSYILNNLQNDYWVTSVNECVKWWIKRENANIRIYYDKNKIIFNSDTELPIEIFYKNKKIYKIIKNDTLEL